MAVWYLKALAAFCFLTALLTGLVPVEITFVQKSASSLPVKGRIVLHPVEKGREPVTADVSSLAPVRLELPAGTEWEVSTDLPGYWAPRKNLKVSEGASRLSLDLWPMGTVSGVLKVKGKGVERPKLVLVKTLAAPSYLKRPPAPPGVLSCPVDAKGAWSCALPATKFDLVITAEGFTPRYRWGVEVPAGKTLSLGTVELERGASVAAWVAVEDGAIEPGKCKARLSPLLARDTELGRASDLQRTAVEREVGKDGFVQLTGLAPGSYVLEVSQPGYPPAKASPVVVKPGAETFLREPLILKRALDISFEISPALDWLGKPWRAQVLRDDPTLRMAPLVFDSAANPEGRFTVSGQSPGRFRVRIQDSLGNRLYSDTLAMEGPDSAAQRIEIKLVDLEGSLRLGDDPLAAILWFDGRNGAGSIRMESDAEGSFHGVLPREGVWRIEIESQEPTLRTWTRAKVEAGRSGRATLNLDLPDARVFGRVVDGKGQPVPEAQVGVMAEGVDPLLVPTGADGTFDIRALPEGTAWLAAESRDRVSGRTLVTLVEDRAVGPIELSVRPLKELTGTVTSSRGPVAGAQVTILSYPSGAGDAATTDDAGGFRIKVPESATRLVAIVSAPGFALRASPASADGAPLALTVSEAGGDLEVSLPWGPEEFLERGRALVFFQNGLPLPATIPFQWARDQGQPREIKGRTFRIPSVAPGEYRVCLTAQGNPMDAVPAEADACDAGTLTPGATLTLRPGG
ncbi:MAG TPA: carboxypeptidase-like regulatory domain-containing protein [Thermoanaerobaculia bacterium]